MSDKPRKTKILFFITKSNFGGAQKYVFDLAHNLPKDIYETKAVLGGEGVLADLLKKDAIEVFSIPSLSRNVKILSDVKVFFTFLNIIKKERPDVIHLNSAKASGLAALAGRIAGVEKIIFTAHGWAFNEDRSWLSKKIIAFLSWITVVLSHKTIAISESVKNDTKTWPFVGKKIIVIKNGIGDQRLLTKEEARAYLHTRIASLPIDACILGTIAELHKNKGLTYAIEAFATIAGKYPNTHYVILGDGEERNTLTDLIQKHNISDRVHLLGYVHNASAYLTGFDIFILPSIKEGLPFVLLEAGKASLPTIATNTGGISEVIIHDSTGLLIEPRNTQAISDAIETLINDAKQRTLLGKSLFDKVNNEFSSTRMTQETFSLYTKK